jgi:hypothetical protein
MRTPRGRAILLGPLVPFSMLAIVVYRQGQLDFGYINLTDGLSLAAFGGAVCLLSILPFAMNQFAIDRSGLTLVLLSPLDTRELLAGKAVGNGLIAAGPAILSAVVALVLFPGGSPALWLSLPLALVATYALAAPGAAALSALFPRTVDLNSIGRGSNAHGAATLLGLLASMASGAASLGVNLAIMRSVAAPQLALTLMLVWLAGCTVVARLLFVPVRALLARRRENLVLIR